MTALDVLYPNPYTDSSILLDDNGLIEPEENATFDPDDRHDSNTAYLIGGAVALGSVYALSQSRDSRASTTSEINKMVNDLAGIVTVILGLALLVYAGFYAFRILRRLMP